MPINERAEKLRLAALAARGLFVEVGNLQIGVRAQQELDVLPLLGAELGVPLHRHAELELAPRHPLELALQPVRVPAKHLHDLGRLDAVEQLDRLRVVHHAADGAVQRLRAQTRPDAGAEGVLGRGALEADAVERQVVHLLLVVERVLPVVLRLLGEDLGVLDEVVPFEWVELLQVLEQRHPTVVLLADDLAQRKQDFLAVMRDEHCKGWHRFDGGRFG
jgi:hypothetical protein